MSIALGSVFLYLGFESGAGGYVTLSIDGAFLLLVGLVSIFAPRADTAEVDFLAALAKQVPGASEYFPQILNGRVHIQFTKDGKIAIIDSQSVSSNGGGVLQVIEPLSNELRRALFKAQRHNHNGTPRLTLTRKFERQLVDKGVLENIGVETTEKSVVVRLSHPVTGVPLLPEYRNKNEAAVVALSSKLLATLCCLVPADIGRDTVLEGIAKDGDDLIIRLGIV